MLFRFCFVFASGCISVVKFSLLPDTSGMLVLYDKRQQVKGVLRKHPVSKYTMFPYLLTFSFVPGGAEIGVDSFSHVGCDV